LMWIVKAQIAEGGVWQTVGASVWRGYGTLARFLPHSAYSVPESTSAIENTLIHVDMRPNWPWILTEVGTYAVAGVLWGTSCFSGLTRRQRAAVPIVSGLFGINSILQAAAALGHGSAGDWRASVEGWMNGAADLVMALALLIDEQLILPAFLIFGVICFLTLVVQHELLYEESGNLLSAAMTSSAFISLLFTTGLVAFRHRALYSARLLVLADKASYDEIWSTELDDPAMLSALVELGSLVQELAMQSVAKPLQLNRLCTSTVARTLNQATAQGSGNSIPWLSGVLERATSIPVNSFAAFSESLSDSLGDCVVDGAVDYLRPVDSLDQLYCQAIALNPHLIAKVQSWALCSRGCFISTATAAAGNREKVETTASAAEHGYCDCENSRLSSGFVLWRDVHEQEQLVGGQVQWAKVKSVHRSIEKCTRSYGKKVSHLLDICRQSIYFDSIAGVAACLAAISSDPDVLISRIKNRFDPSLNSDVSAGFRNLAVSLRIMTTDTRLLGVDMHICEVQLLLIRMAAIKNDEGHKRYILFRNLRGE